MSTDEMLQRLLALEKSNRNLKAIMCTVAAGVVTLALVAAGRPSSFDSIVADEIHVKSKLIVGEKPVDSGQAKTAITLSIEDSPDDTGRFAYISATHRIGSVLSLSTPGLRRPEITVMYDDKAQGGQGFGIFHPQWQKQK